MRYIKPNWPAPSQVKAYTTTRYYNCGANSVATGAAYVETVVNHRKKLRQDLQLPTEPYWLCQEHTAHVVEAGTAIANDIGTNIVAATAATTLPILPVADASYTCKLNTVCVVLTADCLPLLLCNKQGTKVAGIHAGWRGLAAGIIEATMEKMDIDGDDLLVWLGPAIGPTAFVVGEDVLQAFVDRDLRALAAFKAISSGIGANKWLADIYLLAQQRLLDCNVPAHQIYGGEFCTYCNEELFFSYRRDNGNTGRMASLIWIGLDCKGHSA